MIKSSKGKLVIDGAEHEITDVEFKFVPGEAPGVNIKGERIDRIVIDDPIDVDLTPSEIAAHLARWFEAMPEAGHRWLDCVCDEIDPCDRPCVVCQARWPDGVPMFAIDLFTGDVIKHERAPVQVDPNPFPGVPTRVLQTGDHGDDWAQKAVDALDEAEGVLLVWIDSSDNDIGIKTTLGLGKSIEFDVRCHGATRRFWLANSSGTLEILSDNGVTWAWEVVAP